jgi:LytS/YehU family sensor histidine kinase
MLNLQGGNFRSAQGIDFSQAISFNFSVMYLLRELLVITALAFIIRSAKQEQMILYMQHQQLSSELNYLKVQLQPHFFFNTLNNIYSLVLQGSENAAPLIAKHADMMRFIIYDASVATVKLSQDVEFLRNYVEVEKIRYSSRMDILFEVQGINEEAQIEPLLMLPFIENTFKHGLREEINKGFVHIIISLVGKELSAQISNSKSGETVNSTSGLGLENVRKRLEILYPGKHSLKIDETDMNYEVLLTITLRPW